MVECGRGVRSLRRRCPPRDVAPPESRRVSLVRAPRRVAVIAVAIGVVLALPAARAVDSPRRDVVHLTIHNSRFDKRVITVPEGRAVTFVVRNTDPIFHELIIGTRAVHLRHEKGDEPFHAAKPGEVTLAPNTTARTTYRAPVTEPVTFACHLPGHYAYGMYGVVRIR